MKPEEFVRSVWKEQMQKGHGFISVKDTGGGWTDTPYYSGLEVKLPDIEGDMYFTPNLFSQPQRRKEYMMPSRWLYSDFDEVDPFSVDIPRPTCAWETSPGRYQGMWLCPFLIDPKEHQRINKLVTYYVGADKGGWDSTQVLRIPGTRNYKYTDKPKVKMLWR
jgi:RepB DNA-primase from phage plasmid